MIERGWYKYSDGAKYYKVTRTSPDVIVEYHPSYDKNKIEAVLTYDTNQFERMVKEGTFVKIKE